jgi:hypothetical protein
MKQFEIFTMLSKLLWLSKASTVVEIVLLMLLGALLHAQLSTFATRGGHNKLVLFLFSTLITSLQQCRKCTILKLFSHFGILFCVAQTKM